MRKSDLLLFLHISKTGGTSLSKAVAQLFPADRVFFESTNTVTVKYVQSLGDRLNDGGFIAGHTAWGVVTLLRERADIITLLRRPEDQLISNYFHARSDPTSVLYQDATTLSLTEYIEKHPNRIIFQTMCLYRGISQVRLRNLDAVEDELGRIFDLMESMLFVGVLERAEESCAVLSRLLATEYPLHLPHMNTTVGRDGVSDTNLDSLRDQYRQLSRQPRLARLFDVEARVYAKACALLDRHVARAGVAGLRPSGTRTIPPQRFFSTVGAFDAGRLSCPLDGAPGCLVYGPYDRLDAGTHDVEFRFSLSDVAPESRGSIWIEVVADAQHVLARRELKGSGPFSRPARTLTFADRDGTGVLEFRIHAAGGERGRLVFDGVQVRANDGAVSKLSASLSRRLWSVRT